MECDALLADGTPVHLRPIDPSDKDRLVEFHERLSTRTTWLRFFSVHPHLSPREVERFTTVDHVAREALIALTGDDIIGVARFDRVRDTDDAEVAFVVEDRWQGHGVGTLLLEHLTARARDLGIKRFVADTLAENQGMLRVFRDTGLPSQRELQDGVVHLTIPLDPTPQAIDAIEQREHVSEARSIARILAPASVAIVGASDRPGSVGRALVENVLSGGFAGAVYPVHPTAATVAGRTAYASVAAIPETVDLAVVVVPAPAALAVVEECAARGVKGLVVVSAGFAEVGPAGVELQAQLVAAARRHGMRMIGPNCVGVVNTDPAVSLHATFANVRPQAGTIGLLSQSGAVGIAVLDAATRTGVGISTFVSVGNKADVSGNDLLQYWEDDPNTNVVLLYLESLGNPRKFSRIARRVSRRKPIVVVKSGRTPAGTRAASSHTAALASSDVAVDALFREAGVTRVDTIRDMLGVARVFAHQPLPGGRRVAIVGNSGGPGIMAADACDTARLELATFAEETQAALRLAVPAAGSMQNPVDLLASAGPAEYGAAIDAVLADPGIDGLVVVFTPTLVADPDAVARAVVAAASAHARGTKPVVAAFLTGEDGVLLGEDGFAIPQFQAADEAMLALGRAADHADWARRPVGNVPSVDVGAVERARAFIDGVLATAPGGRWLDAGESSELLGTYGIPMLASVVARDDGAAVAAADAFGYPVVLKAASGAIVHKTDVGGVALDLRSAEAVREAWAVMRGVVETGGAVVQPMATPGVETIAGVVQDATFGPLVLFGLGGTATELLGDRCLRLVPLTDTDAAEMIRSLRTSPLLFGHRGAAPVDVDALTSLLTRLSSMADRHPEIAEVDLNPVIASAAGAVVADAKIRLQRAVRALEPAARRLRDPSPR